jgi:hypothetical protein
MQASSDTQGNMMTDRSLTPGARTNRTDDPGEGNGAAPRTALSIGPSRVVLTLGLAIAVLAAVATASGLFLGGGDGERTFVSVRGEAIDIYGKGLYRHDTVFRAAGNKGSDVVTMVFAIPVLFGSMFFYRRGSRVGGLLLAGILTWFLYLYASLALGTAYNPLFLGYVALFSASLFGLVAVIRSLNLRTLEHAFADLPRRFLAGFLFASGLLTLLVWVGPLVTALANDEPPKLLDHSTTMVTDALDLAIITPLTFVAGGLILRRRFAQGLEIAVPLLALLIVLFPVIVLQTVFQVDAGVEFETAEIVGPMGGFLVLGAIASYLMFQVLRCAAPGHGIVAKELHEG